MHIMGCMQYNRTYSRLEGRIFDGNAERESSLWGRLDPVAREGFEILEAWRSANERSEDLRTAEHTAKVLGS